MHRLVLSVLAALVLTGSLGVFQAHAVEPSAIKAQLTEQQKKEIEALHKQILEKRKEVISKYVKYGIISEEKGQKIISRMDMRYEKLKKNGFIPKWDHKKQEGSHKGRNESF